VTQNTIEHRSLSQCDTDHSRTPQSVTMWHRAL